MIYSLLDAATTAGATTTTATASWTDMIPTIVMMVAMIAVFYFLLIRPQRKKDKAVKDMLAALKPGDRICTIGGMVCDGAKSSCAAKIAAALESAFTGLEMSLKQRVFQPGEGLTMDTVEDTIAAVGRMGRVGMKSTDVEILNIMLGH